MVGLEFLYCMKILVLLVGICVLVNLGKSGFLIVICLCLFCWVGC